MRARGCHDGAIGFGTPFISGKDSLRNEFIYGDKVIRIPSTLLISAMCVMRDVSIAVTMDFKRLGKPYRCCWEKRWMRWAALHYYELNGFVGNSAPGVDFDKALKNMAAVHDSIEKGLLLSCHDCSEGGIGVASAEMAFAGGFGAEIDLAKVHSEKGMRPDHILFSESNSRFILEIKPENLDTVSKIFTGASFTVIGKTEAGERFRVVDNSRVYADENIFELKECWQKPLRNV